MHTELMKPGVTLELLHLEYLQEHPEGLKYTAFGDRYRKWKEKRRISMRQTHKAGDKCFVVGYKGLSKQVLALKENDMKIEGVDNEKKVA